MRLHWLIALGFFVGSAPAFAQSAPNAMLGGEMAQAGKNDCFVNRGYSTFQRNFASSVSAGTKAVITLPGAYCQGADLSGQAVLIFNNATSGNIRFKRFPNSVAGSAGLSFANYAETVNAADREITVQFDIVGAFPISLVLEAP
ncbi:hypothetical protein [Methylocystis heyeri]|uniref:Uncharacterized protein n=1 Tax=Methylocystis heyeri TaxID=391905 RepID=A0A6B8KII9_9HYPH|nr:hypothetical protein [Methylocystis heyeri]QGM46353.1 hypothetical protein H2LOC_011945 [Methylocystis heyeri]